MEAGRLALHELAGADHPHHDPVGVPVERPGDQHGRAQEEQQQPVAAERPAGEPHQCGERDEARPCLQHVPRDDQPTPHGVALSVVVGVAVVIGERAGRPVGLGRVAAARAMQRSDVLQRDQDVTVQLDVRDVLDVAIRGQHAVLVLAAEEGDLDLLALVFVRVVLDAAHPSLSCITRRVPFRWIARGRGASPFRVSVQARLSPISLERAPPFEGSTTTGRDLECGFSAI